MEWSEDLNRLGLVALAGGLGAVIGLERELNDKPAGLKTHIFVCAASALLMALGDAAVQSFRELGHERIQADPIRVIQAIIIGIGFLGTGTIIHQRGSQVEGLTTAASIFLTAAIGIAVATRHFVLAVGATVLALTVLVVVGRIEQLLVRKPAGSTTKRTKTAKR